MNLGEGGRGERETGERQRETERENVCHKGMWGKREGWKDERKLGTLLVGNMCTGEVMGTGHCMTKTQS